MIDYFLEAGYSPSGNNGERLSKKIISQLRNITDVQTIVELGCGNGYLAHRLAAEGYKVLGIDSSWSGIKKASFRKNDKAEFLCSEINKDLDEKISNKKFDVAVASEVIEHFYSPRELIDTCKRLLVPGGRLLLTTPYHGYLKNLFMGLLGGWDHHFSVHWEGGHIKFFSVKTLSKLLEESGFEHLKFSFFGRGPWVWKSMICLARIGFTNPHK